MQNLNFLSINIFSIKAAIITNAAEVISFLLAFICDYSSLINYNCSRPTAIDKV